MSWADDIRCLYCDGKLPLYRKITNGQFCSTAHRKAYWEEQERLAVERLHQTHSSLRAYRPQGSVESILGPEEPAFEEFRPEVPSTALVAISKAEADEADRPAWLVHSNAGEVPIANFIPGATFPQPHWLSDSLAGAGPEPFVRPNALRRPVNVYNFDDPRFATSFTAARIVRIPVAARASTLVFSDIQPVAAATKPIYTLAAYQPAVCAFYEDDPQEIVQVQASPENDPAPVAGAVPLPTGPPRDCSCPRAGDLAPIAAITAAPALDRLATNFSAPLSTVPSAGLRPIPVEQAALVPGPWIDSLRALELRGESEPPQFVLSTPPVRPRLRLAAGRRYPVSTRESVLPLAESAGFEASTPDISLPVRRAKVLRAAVERPSTPGQPVQPVKLTKSPNPEPNPNFEPNPSGLLPLACANKPTQVSVRPVPSSTSIPQPLQTEPMRPNSRLEPREPAAGDMPAPVAGVLDKDVPPAFVITPPPYVHAEANTEANRAHVWTHAIDFWNRAPRDLRLLVFAIPALLALALHPRLPKVRVAAPVGIQQNMEQAFNTQWKNVKQTMVDRAAVALDEDFRSGLDEWVSRGDATTDWSFDATGFVKPGPLAMYRPSLGLADYQLQFLGLIDKQALSWVVRAADFDNFYVVKLVVLKGGPLPTIGVTRYSVVNGKADSRVDTVVPVDARTDMLYRIRMDVQGDNFTLLVQGQMVDSWTEPRLRHGGVGFFSARAEASRVRWVQVTHQYDMLGRLCAYLAPYNMPAGIPQ